MSIIRCHARLFSFIFILSVYFRAANTRISSAESEPRSIFQGTSIFLMSATLLLTRICMLTEKSRLISIDSLKSTLLKLKLNLRLTSVVWINHVWFVSYEAIQGAIALRTHLLVGEGTRLLSPPLSTAERNEHLITLPLCKRLLYAAVGFLIISLQCVFQGGNFCVAFLYLLILQHQEVSPFRSIRHLTVSVT